VERGCRRHRGTRCTSRRSSSSWPVGAGQLVNVHLAWSTAAAGEAPAARVAAAAANSTSRRLAWATMEISGTDALREAAAAVRRERPGAEGMENPWQDAAASAAIATYLAIACCGGSVLLPGL